MELSVCKQRVELINDTISSREISLKGMMINKPQVKRGLWKPEEDLILKNYVETHGEGNWARVSQRSGLGRGGKSCRLRWKNYLRPNIKRGHMSKEEEDLIIRMHKLLGNRWSLIAGRLPGRTDNEVKNYWNTHLNKKCLLGKRKIMDPNNYNYNYNNVDDDDNEQEDDDQTNSKKLCQGAVNLEKRNVQVLEIAKRDEEIDRATEAWTNDMRTLSYDLGLEDITTPLLPAYNNSTFFFDDDPFIAYLNSFVRFETSGWSVGEGTYSQLW
ncbi:hypothetical protein ACFE04_010009 [Oxalis oulophora]